MTYRDHGRGSLVLDLRVRHVGRIHRASGTSDPHLFKLLNAMIDTLYQGGRLDLLTALRDGTLAPLEVWDRHRTSELARLPTPDMMRSLSAFATWAERAATGEDNRAARMQAARALEGVGTASGATVADLPARLQAYRAACEGMHHPAFNRARAAVLAYLRDEGLARLRLEVAAVAPLTEAPRARRPFAVAEFRKVVALLEPAYAAIAWALAITGMGRREYWETPWEVLADRVRIHGTKRAGRERAVPRVMPVASPARLYPAFRRAFETAAPGHTPYDLRATFAFWMQEAEIPRTRRRLYLGHGQADVTDSYEAYEVTAFLRADAQRLRRLLGVERAAQRGGLKLA